MPQVATQTFPREDTETPWLESHVVFSPVFSFRGSCEGMQLRAVAWPLQQHCGGDVGLGAELPPVTAGTLL